MAPGRPARWRSADQIAVPAPGPPLASREVRYVRARIQTELGWSPWSDALRVEAGLLQQGDWVARPITLPDDAGVDPAGAAAAGAAVVHARRVARLGPVVRHGARAPPGHAQRQAGLRRPVGARLDRVPAPPPGGHVRRHRPVAPGRERDRRRDRRRLVSRAARLQARRRPVHLRPRGRADRPARGAPRRRLDDGRRDGRHVARVHRRDPIRRPVRRVRDRPSRAPGGMGRAGLRRRGLGAGPAARGRDPAHRAAPGAARAGHRRPADHAARSRTRPDAARRRAEHRGLRPADRARVAGDRRHGPARRGPGAGRVAPPARAAERPGDRHVGARGRRRDGARARVHVPRVPVRRGRDGRRSSSTPRSWRSAATPRSARRSSAATPR